MKYISVILGFIALGLFLCFLKYVPVPYVWAGLVWTSYFGWLCCKQQRELPKALFFNLACLVFILTGVEGYFWKPWIPKEKLEGNYWTPAMFRKDLLLGYVPEKNAVHVVGKKMIGKDLIYEMSFSTDPNGLRQSFPASKQATQAVIFFGCSFTFGVGLNDDQTLPYQTGSHLNGAVQTYNFSYGGYGPHQMLSALENGLVDKAVKERPIYGFYTALDDHISRSAGLKSWSRQDPRYEIDDKGEVYLAGNFDDSQVISSVWSNRIYAYLNKSYLIQSILTAQQGEPTDDDFKRYVKIVVKARDTFEQRFPGAKFHIILWKFEDNEKANATYHKMLASFRQNHIPVHQIEEVLPDFMANKQRYMIEGDGHPTSQTNERIAKYVVENIMTVGK